MESTLFYDPQAAVPGDFCPVCGSERYGPGFGCIRCERRTRPMKELSESYRESAELIRKRMLALRAERARTKNPAEKEKLNKRIRDLTPILTQMNELADLTEHYYDRGYWRGDKYTV